MKSTLFSVVRWLWVAIAVMVLLVTLFLYYGSANSDADTLLAYGMLVLAFPIAFLVAIVVGGIGKVAFSAIGYVVGVSYLTIAVGWLLFFLAGYWQWFVLVPGLWRKARGRQRDAPGQTSSNG